VKKKGMILVLIFILSVSISYAVKTINVTETELVSLKTQARDDDSDSLFYSFTEPLDERGRWQTGYGDHGEYKITITVSDGELSTSEEVLLVVQKKNVAPVIDSFSPTQEIRIDEGQGVDFYVEASDMNKDVLEYNWKVDGNSIATGKTFRYEADYWDEGEHKISVTVSDGDEEQRKEWAITVNNVNREDLLEDIEDISVDEGDVIGLILPDFKSYGLEYAISGPIGDDNYWKTGYDDSGIYNITVAITDRNFSISKRIEVKVINKDRKPVFKPIATAWLKENQKVSIELEAHDPDNDEIEFSADNLPNGALLEGNLFEWTTDHDTVKKESIAGKALDKFHLLYKSFKITFVAKSNGLEERQDVLIIVKDINKAPVLGGIPEINVREGEEVVITPHAVDPDGDDVFYSYSGWIDIDRYMADYDDAGVYKVKVVATDGFLTDETYVMINVKDVNRPPLFSDVDNVEITENERLELHLLASDPDGDSVEIDGESLPGNSTLLDGVFAWIPGYDGAGVQEISFKASDGDAETIMKVNITVHNSNRPPKVISAEPVNIIKLKKNTKVKFAVTAEDPDGSDLTYLWKFSLLEQYKADAAMMRTFTAAGNKKVKVVVSDGEDEAEYIWDVDVE